MDLNLTMDINLFIYLFTVGPVIIGNTNISNRYNSLFIICAQLCVRGWILENYGFHCSKYRYLFVLLICC